MDKKYGTFHDVLTGVTVTRELTEAEIALLVLVEQTPEAE